MGYEKWSFTEDTILKNSQNKTSKELSIILNRSVKSIAYRKQRLNLTQKPNLIKVGETFGRLHTIGVSDKRSSGNSRLIICKCECGKICEIRAARLRMGTTASCGCLNKERTRKATLKNPGEITLNNMEHDYKKGAKARGLSWNLTKNEFRKIISAKCFWCNSNLSPKNLYVLNDGSIRKTKYSVNAETIDRAWVSVNGIDRINSKNGYTIKNCVPCCSECNFSKSDRSAKQFFDHCKRVVDHLSKIIKINLLVSDQ